MLQKRVDFCRGKGQDLSKLIMDGNLKLTSRICGRPVAELVPCKELGFFTAAPCSEPPAFKKRRCLQHATQARPDIVERPEDQVIIAHRRHRILRQACCSDPYQVQLTYRDRIHEPNVPTRWVDASFASPEQLQEYWSKQEANGYVAAKSAPGDLASTSCSTHKESSKGYSKLVRAGRLSGWLIATTSDGIIVHAKRFIGTESISQRYFFIAELAAKIPELFVIIHDDACHLRRFAGKHSRHSALAQRLAYPMMNYIIDRLHAKGHVDEWCKQNCHPEAPENVALVDGVKTSQAERANSVIGRHKYVLRHIKGLPASFYMQEVIQSRILLGVD